MLAQDANKSWIHIMMRGTPQIIMYDDTYYGPAEAASKVPDLCKWGPTSHPFDSLTKAIEDRP